MAQYHSFIVFSGFLLCVAYTWSYLKWNFYLKLSCTVWHFKRKIFQVGEIEIWFKNNFIERTSHISYFSGNTLFLSYVCRNPLSPSFLLPSSSPPIFFLSFWSFEETIFPNLHFGKSMLFTLKLFQKLQRYCLICTPKWYRRSPGILLMEQHGSGWDVADFLKCYI